MKKVLSVFMALVMAFTSLAIVATAADNDLGVIVASDIHLSKRAFAKYTGNTAKDPYAHVPVSGQLPYESNAIATAFFEKAAASDSDIVLLSGDLTDQGREEEHIAFAKMLADFEAKSGKQVYVIPGNHDLFNVTPEHFTELYADFGYSEAIVIDNNSISYTADLDNGYRLLAIDSTLPGESATGVTAERVKWIEAQCKKAAEDGKKVIATMHHNLLQHVIFGTLILPTGIVDESLGLAEVLAANGVQYIFTGHTHDHDIASYTAANGKVIYDVVTNTLNAYPVAYRNVKFGQDVVFKTEYVNKIDTSLLPEGLSDEAVALAEENFTEYTKKCIWIGLTDLFNTYLSPSYLKRLAKIDAKENPEMAAIFDKTVTKLCEGLRFPIYKADETEDGVSLEAMVNANGKTLPASEYTDLFNLAITFYQAHCLGDENFPVYSDEVDILTKGLTAVLNYTLADLTAEEFVVALSYVCTLFGADVPAWLLNFAGSGLSRFDSIYEILMLAVTPLITEFSVDSAPADNNVVLPGYASPVVTTPAGLFDWLKNLFNQIEIFVKSILEYVEKLFK